MSYRAFMLPLVCLWSACSETQIIKQGPDTGQCTETVVGYLDNDGDGFGATLVESCELPAGAVAEGGDCDDSLPSVYPGAPELCNAQDDDCNGVVDDAPVDGVEGFVDRDGDGFGVGEAMLVCPGDGLALVAGDCDDDNIEIHPDAEDICDGIDNDCDLELDEDAALIQGWVDSDGDGHGDPALVEENCDPTGLVLVGDDCDDADPAVSPSATEICGNGVDDDCDGTAGACLPSGSLTLEAEGTLVTAASSSDYASRDFAAGDVDGDGVDDLWVGATGRGRAFLMLGPVTTDVTLGVADAVLENGTQTGLGMALGDLDGDGFADMLVGDIWDGERDMYSGSAWWLSGPVSGGLQLDDAASGKVAASEFRHNLGAELLVCPDADGDGQGEWVITALGDNAYSGAVFIFDSAPSGEVDVDTADGVVYGDASGALLGEALSHGDLDGDGLPELVVGGSGGSGRVVVLSGDLAGSWAASDADAVIAASGGEGLGAAVASGIDLNGDGFADLAVGAPSDDAAGLDHGSVDVYLGPVSGALTRSSAVARHAGATLQEAAGTAVSLVPDLDGDGGGELLVGAPYFTDNEFRQGRAYLVLGPASGSTSLASAQASWKGRGVTEYAGSTLEVAGDVTGDGGIDLLVGAPQETTSGNDAGAVYILGAGGL